MGRQLNLGPGPVRRAGHEASADTFLDAPRVCAMFDKAYVARYSRNGGTMRLVAMLKTADVGGSAKKSATAELVFREIEESSLPERCPWCGFVSAEIIFCKKCRSWVCYGNVRKQPDKREFFTCRVSCGYKGFISDKMESTCGATENVAPPSRSSLGGQSQSALTTGKGSAALPNTNRPRLKS